MIFTVEFSPLLITTSLALCAHLLLSVSSTSFTVSVRQSAIYAPELSAQQLHCDFSRSPGYILWYYSSSPGAIDRAILAQCYLALGQCTLRDGFSNWTNVRGGANGSLKIDGVAKQQDGYYECEGFEDNHMASAGMRLFVLASGSSPVLAVTPSSPISGDAAVLTCSVTGWNPPVNLTWTKTPAGYASPVAVQSGVEVAPGIVKFGRQVSRLTVTVGPGDDRSVWACGSLQPGTAESSVGQLRLRVQHKPTVVPVPDISAIEGSSVSVSCQASGFPVPSIQLLASNGTVLQELSPEDSASSEGGPSAAARFLLAAAVDRSQSGSYSCRASNSLGVSDNAASFNLNVLYPPAAKAPATVRVNEGQAVQIECSVSGNPRPTGVSWRHTVRGQLVRNSSGTGLYFARAERQQTGEWRCEVEALLVTSSGERLSFSATATVQLTVNYAPGPPLVDSLPTTTLAGSTVSWNCQPNVDSPGEPSPNLRWRLVGDAGWLTNQSQLVKQRVRLADSGSYACQAWNSLGTADSQLISLQVVQSPQAIDSGVEKFMIRARQDDDRFGGLVCRISANPQPLIRWWRQEPGVNKSMSLLKTESGLMYSAQYEIGIDAYQYSSSLQFRGSQRYAVKLNDTGEYVCEAVNELGALQLIYSLVVEVPPKITNLWHKVAFQSATVDTPGCRFVSHQPVSVLWTNPEGEQLIGKVSAVNDSLPWQLTSPYPHGNNRSLGSYTCRVNNSLGHDEQVFHAVSISEPDPPISAMVRTLSWDCIEVSWKPGFDGGLPSRLKVLCRGWNVSKSDLSAFELTVNSSQGRLLLTDLYPDTAYVVSLTPVNQLGTGRPYLAGSLAATTGHLRLPVADQPRWNQVECVLAFRLGDSDCASDSPDGCYCVRLQTSTDGGDSWLTVLNCSPLAKSNGDTKLKLDDPSKLYRVSMCLKVRPDVCGAPYTTYTASGSQSASVSTAAIILVICACSCIVAILGVALVCLCVRRCNSSRGQGKTGSSNATSQPLPDFKSIPASDEAATATAAAAAHPTASIRSHRSQAHSQLVGAAAAAAALTDRSSNQTQETGLDSGSFSLTNGSSSSPVPPRYLDQHQLYNFSQQPQLAKQQMQHISYGSDATDSGCYFSSGLSPPPPPRKVIYEVVV